MEKKVYRRGLRNNYRGSMPLVEVFLKDVASMSIDFFRWLKNGFSLPVIVVWPDYPSKKTTIFKVANFFGFRITNFKIKNPTLVVYFEDTTYGSAAALKSHFPNSKILNVLCDDISKIKVDSKHQEVFGYNTFIDPTTYHGKAVMKSDTNALHDGQIVECPISKEELQQKVYQVLIDNSFNNDFVIDYRVPVVLGVIPHIYRKYKRYDVRFTNNVEYSDMQMTIDHFTMDEQKLIVNFAAAMGADFCELDVLRNNVDGKIYIIDVNKTPYGPPFGLSKIEVETAVKNLAEAIRPMLK